MVAPLCSDAKLILGAAGQKSFKLATKPGTTITDVAQFVWKNISTVLATSKQAAEYMYEMPWIKELVGDWYKQKKVYGFGGRQRVP